MQRILGDWDPPCSTSNDGRCMLDLDALSRVRVVGVVVSQGKLCGAGIGLVIKFITPWVRSVTDFSALLKGRNASQTPYKRVQELSV